MRGWTTTIVIFLCAIVVIGLFHFLFKNQMDKKVQALDAENTGYLADLKEVARMEAAITPLARQVPYWKKKIGVYRAAVPSQIEDNVFFSSLRQEMDASGVKLLSVHVTPGGPWLGNIKDDDSKKLSDIGVDVDAARALKVAFYQIQLVGPYSKTLTVLENLKRHGRMYSIDQVAGPGGSGGGSVTKVLDPTSTPLQVTGKIFYGLPEEYVSEKELNQVFDKIILRPIAGRIQGAVTKRGQKLTHPDSAGKEQK